MASHQPPDSRRAQIQGIAIGLLISCGLFHAWLTTRYVGAREMYDEFLLRVPWTTKLALSHAWQWGVAAGCGWTAAALVYWRPRSYGPYVVVAALAIALAWATPHYVDAPSAWFARSIK